MRVETGGLRAAGGEAQGVAAELRGFAGEVAGALAIADGSARSAPTW